MKKIFSIIIFLFIHSHPLFCQTQIPYASIIKHFSAYEAKGLYCAWPAITQVNNGDILVAFCRAEEHLSPTGELVFIKSTNKGETWSKPEVIFNTPLDERHASFLNLKDGRIIALLTAYAWKTKLFEEDFVKINAYRPDVLKRWTEYTKTKVYKDAESMAGGYIRISSDNGTTWSEPQKAPETFRGGFEMTDNSLLITGYGRNSYTTLHSTNPQGNNWIWSCDTLHFPKYRNFAFDETVMHKLTNGRIIMMLRATATPYDNSDKKNLLWETYSDDNGKTWIEPYPTPIWGYPAHILQLEDGRVVISYSYRREPFGERVCISEDGITWKHENELILRDDGPNEDLGYPVSLEIEPNKILTVYYQPNVPKGIVQEMKPPDPNRVKPGILGTIWNAPKKVGK